MGLAAALGLAIWCGSGLGHFMTGSSQVLLTLVLGFGVAALLFLVSEDLLAEAHQQEGTPLVTAFFLIGFLVPFFISYLD